MKFKNLLKKECIKQRKQVFLSILLMIFAIPYLCYAPFLAMKIDHMIIIFIPWLFITMALALLTGIVWGFILNRTPIKMKIKNLNELKFLIRTKQKLKKKIKIEICYKDISKELQKKALIQLSKKELQLFNDVGQIHKTTTFKETLVEQYPLDLNNKMLTKLNDNNYLKLLKDMPKTKIEDFLEDRVKKTIA